MSTTGQPSRNNGYIEIAKFFRDPLEYLTTVSRESDAVARFKLVNKSCMLLLKPEHLKLAMHNNDWPPISRGRLSALKRWYHEGLFLSHGPEHHRQRDDIWKPLFNDPRIPVISVERTAGWGDRWREGEPIDLYKELRTLGWSVDWDALVGRDLTKDPEVLNALELGVDALAWLLLPYGSARWSWPLPRSMRTRAARDMLDNMITRMIADRRAGKDTHRNDLLTQLVRLADRDSATTDGQVRATVKMYFGADQLHALFFWTFHLLAQHPKVEAAWHAELDSVLGGRKPSVSDLSQLPYTRKMIMESMRVYPPVWIFFREMVDDYRLGDLTVPKGTMMGMSPWVTHRDPRVWSDPLRFDPERWNKGVPRPPELSFFPFSAGPYECHGKELAMTQAVLMLATLGQRWRFRHAGSPSDVKPTGTWATEPKGGLFRPERRRVQTAAAA